MRIKDHPYYNDKVIEAILAHGSREQIIHWLQWNDSDGVYTDEDCYLEGMPMLSYEDALQLMKDAIND